MRVDIPIYVVDAFTCDAFAGNPAAVCLLESAADPKWMQNVAMEMKHAETAFVRPLDDGFELRWFTPTVEVDLCGHGTLASAHALWAAGRLAADEPARFHTRSGLLIAKKEGQIHMDFPAEPPVEASLPRSVPGLNPVWSGKNRMDWFAELESEPDVRSFVPEFESILSLGLRGLMITAKGSGEFDFVSRFFAPQAGVTEDAVTGSAHCCLGPYWAAKLGKNRVVGFQASDRGGIVTVEVAGSRVVLIGDAVVTLAGVLKC